MKEKRACFTVLMSIVCIALDIIGRIIADRFSFPFWFDSFGTILIAYMEGPFCGAVIGLANNIIYGVFVESQSLYCFVGILIGISVGIAARRKVFESPYKVALLGMFMSLICTLFSVPINLLYSDGNTGIIWGDQVIHLYSHLGFPHILSCILGQFYIEFLDKSICVFMLHFSILIGRKFRSYLNSRNEAKHLNAKNIASAILVFAGLCFFQENLQAQNHPAENYNEYTQSIYSEEAGLTGKPKDIAQTKDGRIWIGTYAGLYSYDGTRFKQFRGKDTIKNVNTLYVDEEGRLWVGTNDNGFSIMINGRIMNVFSEDEGLPSNAVRSIVCDSEGFYYIGTSAGLSIINLSSGVKIKKNFTNIKNAISLAADSNGNVVAITDSGKLYWIRDEKIIEPPINGLEGFSYTTAYFNTNGDLLLGNSLNQIFLCRKDGDGFIEKEVNKYPKVQRINSFFETEAGELFVCSDTGIAYFDSNRKFTFLNSNHFGSCIVNMAVDYQGNLWFVSSRLGALRLCKSPFAELFSESGIEGSVTNAVVKWDSHLYCGTDQGLVIIDEEKRISISNEITAALKNSRIRGINKDSKDNLWISTAGAGLFRISRKNGNFNIKVYTTADSMPGMRFRNVIELDDGTIVSAGDRGVAYIKDGIVAETLGSEEGLDNIKSLCLLKHFGKVYIGSDGGGISVVENGKIIRKIKRADGLSSNVILRMVHDKKSEGIFVVVSNGLCYIAKDGTVSQLEQFPYSNNYDIITGENNTLWILGSAGIYVADSDSLIADEEHYYELINSRRGLRTSLTANSINYLEDGLLYLCCDSGIIKVKMEECDFSTKTYRMILDRVKVDGSDFEISRTKPLSVPPFTKKVVFEPEILNYSLNDPYVSYYLEGFDASPKVLLLSELDNVIYSNLKSGTYNFVLSVLDNRKSKVLETGSYKLIVEKEMYQNWWFKFYVIIVTFLIISWLTWIITKIQLQKAFLKQKLELEYARKQLKMGKETILSIARAVDAKDTNTSEHSFRVSEYSVAIARRYGFDENRCETLRQIALLHDIGKIGIPDSILNKPSRLSEKEYQIMKTHVLRGGEILKDFTLVENVNIGALYHHERYDGTGYCKGLKGEEIPIEARIVGIADAFDAMTANRVYRQQLDLAYVIEELKRGSGSQFDPELIKIMLSLIEEGEIDVEQLYGKSKENKGQ